MKQISAIESFAVLGVIFAICMFVMGIYSFIRNEILYRWLKFNMHDRWVEITTADTIFGKIGPGIVSGKKGWKYVYSDLDDENEEVRTLKGKFRIGIRYCGLFLFATALSFGIAISFILLEGRP